MNNDWLLLNIDNPEYDPGDFHTLGIDTSNTLFLSKDEYKKTKFVKEHFTDDKGNFSEDKFDKYYDYLALGFSKLDSADYELKYDVFDPLKDYNGKREDIGFNIYRISNPLGKKVGASGINQVSDSPFSEREWAEKQKVVDSATGEEFDYSPNEHALLENPIGWITDLFSDPLVLATYDEDGEHEDLITHEIVKHKKGEAKLNKEGKPYYETLNGRSLADKQVLSLADTFTVDGTTLNKYDCFDSDDIEKSVAGVIAKTAWAIAPLFTPISPYYSGILIARELLKTLPMLDGVISSIYGNDEPTRFTEIANTLAGKAESLTGSQSDYARQNTFTFEGVANLLSDVAILWGQLKFIAKAFGRIGGPIEKILENARKAAKATYTKQADKIKKGIEAERARELSVAASEEAKTLVNALFDTKLAQLIGDASTWDKTVLGQTLIAKNAADAAKRIDKFYKMGRDASLAYMSIVSNTDVYQSMLEHGATKREATLVALASTIGMYAVDKLNGFDRIFFDEILSENRRALRAAFLKEAEMMLPEFLNIFRNRNLTKALKVKELFNKGRQLGKNATNTFISDIKDHTASFMQKAIAEGLEEVSEELVSDLSKLIYLLAGELGANTSVRNVGAFDNWDLKKLAARYGMNFLGGFLGGSVFYGVDLFQNGRLEVTPEMSSIVYAMRTNKTLDVLNYLDKLHKQGRFGSTTLSANPMTNPDGTIYLDDAGNRVYNTAKKGERTVNDFIYDRLREEVMQIDGIIREHGDNLSDEDIFKNLTYDDVRFEGLNDYLKGAAYSTKYFEFYQELLSKYVSTEKKLREMLAPDVKSSDAYQKYEEEVSKLKLEKDSYRILLDQFKQGLFSMPFLRMMLLKLDSRINPHYLTATFSSWLYKEKGVTDPNSLEQTLYDKYKLEYLELVKPFEKDDLLKEFQEFEFLEKTILPELLQILELLKDFKVWHDKIMELFSAKGPFNTMIKYSYDSILPDETAEDDEYKNRNIQMEGEPNDIYELRKKQRIDRMILFLNQEDSRVLNEAIQILESGHFIDSATKRRLLSMIRTNKQNIVEEKKNNEEYATYLPIAASSIVSKIISELKGDFSNIDEIKEKLNSLIERQAYKNELDKTINRAKSLTVEGLTYEEVAKKVADSLLSLVGKEYSVETKQDYINAILELYSGAPGIEYELAINEGTGDNLVEDLLTLHLSNLKSYKLSEDVYKYTYNEAIDDVEEYGSIIDGETPEVMSYIKDELDNAQQRFERVIDSIKSDPYYKFLDYVLNMPTRNNPIIDVVKKLALAKNRDYKDIESLLQTLYDRAVSGDTSNFRLTQAEQEALDEASDLLWRAYGYIYAAKDASVAVNPFQHNKTVNAIAKKAKIQGWEDLPVIDESVSDLYQKEILDYLREIGIKEGDGWTQGSWRFWNDESLRNRINRFLNASSNFTSVKLELIDTYKDKFKGEGFDLFEGIDSIPKTNDAVYLHRVEDLFYNNVLKALKTYLNFGEILDLTGFRETLLNSELIELNTVELDENTKLVDLTSTDRFMYFLSIAGISSSDFHRFYKNEIESSNIAPLITQKTADRIACAMLNDLNGANNIWKSGIAKLKEWSGSKAILFTNLYSLFGNGGSGKTVGCIKVIRDFVGGNKEDVWIIAPGIEQLENLQSLDAKTYVIQDAIKELIGENSSVWENTEVGGHYIANLLKTAPALVSDKLPKCIIIDESTHIDSLTLLVLHNIALEHNIGIIGVGDDIQNGYLDLQYIGEDESLTTSNLGDSNFVFCGRSNRLAMTLRDANLLKADNGAVLSRLTSKLLHIPLAILPDEREKRIRKALEEISKIKLKYFSKDVINGDYYTESLTDNIIEKLKGLKVAFVGAETSNSFLELVKQLGRENVKLYDAKSIQGREFRYVIVDLKWPLPSTTDDLDEKMIETLQFMKMLYTMSTRSMDATIYVDNNLNTFFKDGGFEEVQYKGTIKTFNDEIIEKFKNNELDLIKSLGISESTVTVTGATTLDKVNDLIDKMNSETDYTKWKNLEVQLKSLLKNLSEDDKSRVKKLEDAPEKPTEDDSININESDDGSDLDIERLLLEQRQLSAIPVGYLSYSTNTYAGVVRTDKEYDFTLSSRGNKICDLLLVNVDNYQRLDRKTNVKEIDELVRRLLTLKSRIVFGKKYDKDISDYLTKDEYDNMKFYVVAIPREEFNDHLIGLTDLNEDEEAFSPDRSELKYVFRLVGRFEREGKIYEISLSNLSNPETTVAKKDEIVSNAKDRMSKHPEEAESLQAYIESINTGTYLLNYKNFLKNLVDSSEKELEIPKENISFNESRISFYNVDEKSTVVKFRLDNKYLKISPVYFYRASNDGGTLKLLLRQRACIFVSTDLSIPEDELVSTWINELEKKLPHSVLMIRLLNRGVTLSDLISKSFKDLYKVLTVNGLNIFPSETRALSYKMLTALWNFRADLVKFQNEVNNKLSDLKDDEKPEDVDSLLQEYADAVHEAIKDIPEELRSEVLLEKIKEVIDSDPRFKLIEDINDSLSNPEFKLGKRSDGNTIIRKNKDSYYIHTTLANTQNMIEIMDLIFEPIKDVILVTLNDSPVKRDQNLGDEDGRISWKISGKAFDLSFDMEEGTYKFPDSGDIRFLPLYILKLYSRSGAYQGKLNEGKPEDYEWTESSQLFLYKDSDKNECEIDLKELIEKGKKTQDVLDLALFGSTEGIYGTERASRAYFKNGILIDPTCGLDTESAGSYEGGDFVKAGNSEYSFYVPLNVRPPRLYINKLPSKTSAPLPPPTPNKLEVIKFGKDTNTTDILDKTLKEGSDKSIRELCNEAFNASEPRINFKTEDGGSDDSYFGIKTVNGITDYYLIEFHNNVIGLLTENGIANLIDKDNSEQSSRKILELLFVSNGEELEDLAFNNEYIANYLETNNINCE